MADQAQIAGWTPLTYRADKMTCPMPADETIVEVMLKDGTVMPAWFSCNIMEAGDWDFLPVKEGEPDEDANSLSDKIVAWRAARSALVEGGEAVANIVPEGCTSKVLVFSEGVLHVHKDGSGYIAIDEEHWALEDDRDEGPDGPEGSVHWITRFPPGEMQSLKNFLNGVPIATPAPADERVVEASTAARFARLHGIVSRILWTDLGVPASDNAETKAALDDLTEYLFADGVDAALKAQEGQANG